MTYLACFLLKLHWEGFIKKFFWEDMDDLIHGLLNGVTGLDLNGCVGKASGDFKKFMKAWGMESHLITFKRGTKVR